MIWKSYDIFKFLNCCRSWPVTFSSLRMRDNYLGIILIPTWKYFYSLRYFAKYFRSKYWTYQAYPFNIVRVILQNYTFSWLYQTVDSIYFILIKASKVYESGIENFEESNSSFNNVTRFDSIKISGTNLLVSCLQRLIN